MPKQRFGIIGQVVDDLYFRPLDAGTFQLGLKGRTTRPQFKGGGYFLIPGVPAGNYRLTIGGPAYQARELPVVLDRGHSFVDVPGDNECRVLPTAFEALKDRVWRVRFATVTLARELRAGTRVWGADWRATLLHNLGPGPVNRAGIRMETECRDPRVTRDPIRLVRDRSIRLKFGPWHRFQGKVTVLAGRVVDASGGVAVGGIPLSITAVNGRPLQWSTVAGLELGCLWDERPWVLGSRDDLQTLSTPDGLFHFYFPSAMPIAEIGFRVKHPRFLTQTHTRKLCRGTRTFTEIALNPTPSRKSHGHPVREGMPENQRFS